jgi:uncharacterized protein (DUF1015 family)
MARVGELSDVVAPPYDVIGAALHDALCARHPANIVRLELNKPQPGDGDSANPYTRAAAHLREWRADGTLVQDPDPALYVYHQQFTVAGRSYTRRGFIARLKLEPFGTGQVFPHEETMPGPKADRLRLMHATAMNLSPIFGVYPDDELAVQETLERVVRGKTPLQAADHLGVVSRLWPVSSHAVVSETVGRMGPRPIYIADGHHRYETALRYRDEKRAAGELSGDEHPANFVLMTCVAMSEPGLVILPTHRLVSGLPGLDGNALRKALAAEFTVDEIGIGPAAGRDAWEWIEAEGTQQALGFCTASDGRWFVARLNDASAVHRRAPQHGDAWCSLGVSILHEVVLNDLLGSHRAGSSAPTPETARRESVSATSAGQPAASNWNIRYVHLTSEVLDAVAGRTCDLACLVAPATIDDLRTIAGSGERMPAKSTYFYPKLLTGLVLNALT